MQRSILSLLLAVLLLGCPATRSYNLGVSLEERGKPYAAVEHYLDALDRKPGHSKALPAAAGVAQDGYDAQLARAREAEERGDYMGARERYIRLRDTVKRLDRHGIDVSQEVDLDTAIAESEESAAAAEYKVAEKAFDGGDWALAIERFQAADGIRPGFRDVAERIAATYLAWGAEDVAEGRFREGAERYLKSEADESSERAAEVYAALGRHFLADGACRQAARDLAMADGLVQGVVNDDLAAAWACSEVRVVVERIAPGRSRRIAGVDVGEGLISGLLEALPDETTEFVAVFDSTITGRSGPAAIPHYRVAGTIVAADRVDQGVDRTAQTTVGAVVATCTETGDDGVRREVECEGAVDVEYDVVEHGVEASLSATIRLLDGKTRRVIESDTFVGEASDHVRYAELFTVDGDPVTPAADTAGGVKVDSNVLGLAEARTDLRNDEELVLEAMASLVDGVSAWVAERVDYEEDVSDPAELEIVALR